MIIGLVHLLIQGCHALMFNHNYFGTILVMVLGIVFILAAVGVRIAIASSIAAALRWLVTRILFFWPWVARQLKKLFMRLKMVFQTKFHLGRGISSFLAFLIVALVI